MAQLQQVRLIDLRPKALLSEGIARDELMMCIVQGRPSKRQHRESQEPSACTLNLLITFQLHKQSTTCIQHLLMMICSLLTPSTSMLKDGLRRPYGRFWLENHLES
ncbi:hypothetical protein M758_UG294900 [Ceratodon purpureus]|nr:hypothetical protein M758_UG294900 [Ceratodon purpureus]